MNGSEKQSAAECGAVSDMGPFYWVSPQYQGAIGLKGNVIIQVIKTG